jgi:3-deoxy-D-manno-octulosonate 8-phosphate phosphatase (KDO 8-P phosphatase)
VKTRAEKLKITQVHLGVKDKKECLDGILERTGMTLENIAYIGDDVNDTDIIEAVNERGITACPWDAMENIKHIVHYTCRHRGGNGAFRDFAEFILGLRT